MKKITLSLLCLVTLKSYTQVKIEYPEIGKPCPDFAFTNAKYYKEDQVTLESLKGKHAILDFWSKNCLGCILSMPKIDSIQRKFKDQLQIIMIGYAEAGIETLYERVKSKHELNLAVAFDSASFDRIAGENGVPRLVWIDDKGIVKAITGSSEITAENVCRFINNESFTFIDRSKKGSDEIQSAFDSTQPLLIEDNGGNSKSFMFRSILAEANPVIPRSYKVVKRPPLYQVTNLSVIELLDLAYFNTGYKPDSMYKHPIIESERKEIFEYDRKAGKRGNYSYSLCVPDSKEFDGERMMKIMQRDLQNYFGLTVSFENRKVPCLSFQITDQAKAKSLIARNTEKPLQQWSKAQGGMLVNQPVSDALNLLVMSLGAGYPPFVFDDSNIRGNITLEVNVLLSDLPAIRTKLKKYGVDLIAVEREMKTMVIKDEL